MLNGRSESKSSYPLVFAIAEGHITVAKTLVSHMCKGATQSQLDDLLCQVVEGGRGSREVRLQNAPGPTISETIELICMALIAGASPNQECLKISASPLILAYIKQLVDDTRAGIIPWLEIGLLEYFLIQPLHHSAGWPAEFSRSFNDILHRLLDDYRDHLSKGCPRLKKAMRSTLHVAITQHSNSAVERILSTINSLGYRLIDEEIQMGDLCVPAFTNNSILKAFDATDWTLAASLMLPGSPDQTPSYGFSKKILTMLLKGRI